MLFTDLVANSWDSWNPVVPKYCEKKVHTIAYRYYITITLPIGITLQLHCQQVLDTPIFTLPKGITSEMSMGY